MKVYILSNLDGTQQCMVAAVNLTEAAKHMRVSVGAMQRAGWRPAQPKEGSVARSKPGVPFYRPIVGDTDYPWSEKRYHRRTVNGQTTYVQAD
jgi:hypothetical protein